MVAMAITQGPSSTRLVRKMGPVPQVPMEVGSTWVTKTGDETALAADQGFIIVKFDNNVLIPDGTASNDITVWEACSRHSADAGEDNANIFVSDDGATWTAVGLANNTPFLGFPPAASGGGIPFANSFDLDGLGLAFITHVKIVNTGTVIEIGANGFEADAVEALHSLGVDDIVKAIVGDDDIDIGVGNTQPFTFTITITNNTGISNGLAGLTFLDVVPAEFDVTSISVDNTTGAGDDGQDECVASFSEPTKTAGQSGPHKKQKLAPDFITITADNAGGLADGEFCIVTVNVTTDTQPGGGRSPNFTPTSCLADPGTITLNNGVRVLDPSGNILLEDDDSLTLDCTSFTVED